MITEQIYAINEIDDAFTGIVVCATSCEKPEPTFTHAGLLRAVFDQHNRVSTLFTPENDNEQPWCLDNSTDFQTLHILQGGQPINTRKFGSRTLSDYQYQMITVVVHFSPKSFAKETIQAIEQTDWCEVVSFDLDTESILSRYLLLRADEDFNYPPYMTAWAVTYNINGIH